MGLVAHSVVGWSNTEVIDEEVDDEEEQEERCYESSALELLFIRSQTFVIKNELPEKEHKFEHHQAEDNSGPEKTTGAL